MLSKLHKLIKILNYLIKQLHALSKSTIKVTLFVESDVKIQNFSKRFKVYRFDHITICERVNLNNQTNNIIEIKFLRIIGKTMLALVKPDAIILSNYQRCGCRIASDKIEFSSFQYLRNSKTPFWSDVSQTIYLRLPEIKSNRKSSLNPKHCNTNTYLGLLDDEYRNKLDSSDISKLIEARIFNNFIEITKEPRRPLIQKYQAFPQNIEIHGIGDFIFGCFKVHEIASKFGFKPMVDISDHPISSFLNGDVSLDGAVTKIFHSDSDLLFLKNELVFTNKRPKFTPSLESRDFVLSKALSFRENFEEEYQNMISVKRLPRNIYTVVHLRIGDYQLFGKQSEKIQTDESIQIINAIKKRALHDPIFKNAIYLADSEILRSGLLAEGFYTLDFPIAHLGNSESPPDSVKYTLMEFRILLCADSIIQISAYPWGSAFSETASILGGASISKVGLLEFVKA